MIKDFQLYKSFYNEEDALIFGELLEANQIPFLLDDTRNHFDQSIVGRSIQANFIIKIPSDNFKEVNSLIIEEVKNINPIELEKHHLNVLENDELKEILIKPDEWAIEDSEIARQILIKRGIDISQAEIELLRGKRLDSINKGKDASVFWLCLTFLSIVIGIIVNLTTLIGGVAMGYYYSFGKTTDLDGNRHYVYSDNTRFIGKIVFFIGSTILFFEFLILFGIYNYRYFFEDYIL